MEESIVRALQENATAEERERSRALRSASPDQEREYLEIDAVWILTGVAATPKISDVPSASVIVRGAARRHIVPIGTRRRSLRYGVSALLLAAATVLALIGGTRLFPALTPPSSPRVLEALDVRTGPSEVRLLPLGDGTLVHLGPSSQLQIMPVPGRREVRLEGRAFVGVASDPEWPFVVQGRVGRAVALGTRFEVEADSMETRVVVIEGRVALERGSVRVELDPMQVGEVTWRQPEPLVRALSDADGRMGRMGGSLLFHNTPRQQVAMELQARHGLRVEILDGTLEGETATGAFEGWDPVEVVGTICRAISAHCEVADDQVTISRVVM